MSLISQSLYRLTRILLIITSLSFTASLSASEDYSQVYVFGDSLSDTGNLASILGGLPAPYDSNRVSNGPVAVETLAQHLERPLTASLHLLSMNHGTNYAVARARIIGDRPVDLQTQLISYFLNHNYLSDPDALYVVFIGGNDIRTARGIEDFSEARAHVEQAATQVIDSIQQLVQSGARHFLIVNAPDIGAIPETLLLSADNPLLAARASQLSQHYRLTLKKNLKPLQKDEELELTLFDLMKVFHKITQQAHRYGFEYTTEPCFYLDRETFHEACANGQNVDAFLYFDEIHPTSRLHGIIGDAFYEALD